MAYNQVRESESSGVIRLAHIYGKFNPSNLMTNPLGPQQYCPLMKELLV